MAASTAFRLRTSSSMVSVRMPCAARSSPARCVDPVHAAGGEDQCASFAGEQAAHCFADAAAGAGDEDDGVFEVCHGGTLMSVALRVKSDGA